MTASPPVLELAAGALRLALRPDLGASLAGLWHRDRPVLRSSAPEQLAGPRAAACYPLLPYSNRIGHCRFAWGGRDRQTHPNVDGSPHSLHGVGWQRPWTVVRHEARQAELALHHPGDADWPFAFDATQTVTLEDDALALRLTLVNRAGETAPAGLGWHPYFPKRPRSRIHAEVAGRWENDDAHLPARHAAQPGIDADVAWLDYDHCFTGWQGAARLRDELFALKLTSSLERLVVYTPPLRDYYCVEPVSHVNNALNLPDPAAHGMQALAPGAVAEAWMRLEIQEVHR